MKGQTTNPNAPICLTEGDDRMLDDLLKVTFDYFLHYINPVSGFFADKSSPGCPTSIAVLGMGLSSYIVGIENQLISKSEAISKILKLLRFLYHSDQSADKDASGYKGFYYHFLDMETGKRVWNCEISTIDTALLMAGVLSLSVYFCGENDEEIEIRHLADLLYRRVDWQWALNGETTLSHGWKPESGFISYRWDTRYNEAMILYVLAMGSPTFPISSMGYNKWVSTFEVIEKYDVEYIYAGPLFIHQFSHMWIDFRGIHDVLNKKLGFDYFENSRRATMIHRSYARENPGKFNNYGDDFWGLSAGDGPGRKIIHVNGNKFKFFGYLPRGAPYGPDDGTVSPWSVVASLPFYPQIVLDSIRHLIEKLNLCHAQYGFEASFNPTFPPSNENHYGWASPWRFGLNQGAIILMIANYQTGLIWNHMKKSPFLIAGLKKAGFTDGWLGKMIK